MCSKLLQRPGVGRGFDFLIPQVYYKCWFFWRLGFADLAHRGLMVGLAIPRL